MELKELKLYRHRVVFQRRVQVDGFKDATWTDVRECWAKITPTGGRDSFVDGGTEIAITHKVSVRWHEDIAPEVILEGGHRIKFGERLFKINYAEVPMEIKVTVEILATEGVAT